jgi:long-chain fatty acid transport protein
MKKNILHFTKWLCMTYVLWMCSISSFAGGFQVNLMSVKQIGMGHLGIGLKLDGSSIYFNPAALSVMPTKYSFSAGGSGIIASSAFRNNETNVNSTSKDPLGTPFYFYGAAKLTDRLSVGLGIYTPFGSSVDWGNNWQGKFLIQNVSLKAIFFQPTVSFKLHERISIGAGLIYAYGSVKLNKALPINNSSGADGQATLSGTTGNWGVNAGIFIQATDKLTFGLTYKSRINMNVKNGKAEFNVPGSLASSFPSGNTFSASIPLPASLNAGVGFQATEKLLVGLDVNYMQWNAYDSLNFDFKQNSAQLTDSKNPRKYKNTVIVRVGGQYKLCEKLTVRAGAYYDMTPVPSNYVNPETPDANRVGLSAGLSFFPCKQFSIDASFLYVDALKRDATYSPANFAGTYKTNAYIPGLGLSYNF